MSMWDRETWMFDTGTGNKVVDWIVRIIMWTGIASVVFALAAYPIYIAVRFTIFLVGG